MFCEGINAKVFRRSIAFAIAVVVTSRSSSFKYTISVHAVHAGAERNVCNIVVTTETPQNFHRSISNAAPCVQTLTPAPPQVLTSKNPTTSIGEYTPPNPRHPTTTSLNPIDMCTLAPLLKLFPVSVSFKLFYQVTKYMCMKCFNAPRENYINTVTEAI